MSRLHVAAALVLVLALAGAPALAKPVESGKKAGDVEGLILGGLKAHKAGEALKAIWHFLKRHLLLH